MGWTGNGFIAASQRPVLLRCRADLKVQLRERGGQSFYVIKSPLTLSYCQLQAEEYWLLSQLNGQRSLDELKHGFESHFPGKRLDQRRMETLIRYLYQLGLLTSCASGQGHQLLRKKHKSEQSIGLLSAQRLLTMRFRGINPDRMLTVLARKLNVLLHWPSLLLMLSFVFATVAFALANWSALVERLPSIQNLIELQSILCLVVALAAMKVLHELAHGVTCKAFGGECNELGLMLLLFVPCLYCDVSDSWMIESRKKRIGIASAGVLAESIVAAFAFWIWWFANPGVIQTIAMQVCIVGSISTLLINGNPLMRYDGYFVLSDLWDFPNLWTESRRMFWNRIHQFYSTVPVTVGQPWKGRSTWLASLYALASIGYQIMAVLFVMVVIFAFCSARRIELIGSVLLSGMLGAMVFQSATNARRRFVRAGGMRKLRHGRAAVSFLVLAILVAGVFWVPLPFSIHAPGLVRSPDLDPVLVLVKGRLVSAVPDGTAIEAGQAIAQLQAPELLLALESRRGELLRQQARLQGLESRRAVDKSVAVQIPPVREAIEGLEVEVAKLEKEVDGLVLRAARKGQVVFPQAARTESAYELTTPVLAQQNIGGLLNTGTIVAWIRHTEGIEVITFLTQHQVQWVRVGQPVNLKLKWWPTTTHQGRVIDIGTSELRNVPAELIATGVYTFKEATQNKRETIEPVYAVRIRCESTDGPVYENALANVSIQVDKQPLSLRLVHWFHEAFTVSIRGSRQQPL